MSNKVMSNKVMSNRVMMNKMMNNKEIMDKNKTMKKVALLFSLDLPKDVLNVVKQFLFIDDKMRVMSKLKNRKTINYLQEHMGGPTNYDYESDMDMVELADDGTETVIPSTTFMNVYWMWDYSNTVCLSCGNYLCSMDVCYGNHTHRVHCLCNHHRYRIHNHIQ